MPRFRSLTKSSPVESQAITRVIGKVSSRESEGEARRCRRLAPRQHHFRSGPECSSSSRSDWRWVSFATFLLLIPASTMAGKFGGGHLAQGAVLIAAFAVLFLTYSSRSSTIAPLGRGYIRLLMAGLVGVGLSAFANAVPAGMVQSLLLILAFATVYCTAPRVPENHLRKAFLAYAVGAFFLFATTYDEWNPNALAVNVSFIAILFFSCAIVGSRWSSRALYGIAFGAAVTVNVLLESRTATVALVSSILSWRLMRTIKPNKATIIFVMFALLTMLLFIYQGGGRLLQDLAISHMDSGHPLAEFFLNDKDVDKVNEDLFDRRAYWNAAVESIKRNPLLGIGYGEPLPDAYLFGGVGGRRAHNAYLEIGYQTGLLVCVVWVAFYFFVYLFFALRVARCDSRVVDIVGFISISYLILAGMMESSGLLSLSVPGHWICVSCFFWCLFRLPHPRVSYSRIVNGGGARGRSLTRESLLVHRPKISVQNKPRLYSIDVAKDIT